MHGRASRLRFALLKFVDRSLRQARSTAQLSLAPAEHRPYDTDLGRKSLPLEAHNLVETTRLSIELYCHCATDYRQRKAPGSFPPRAEAQVSMINRSGIEVAMDTEPERPVVRVVPERKGIRSTSERLAGERYNGAKCGRVRKGTAVQLGVHHV